MVSGERDDGTAAQSAHQPGADAEKVRRTPPHVDDHRIRDVDKSGIIVGGGVDSVHVQVFELFVAAGGAGFAVPFVKAIATKAGEDCYQALRNMIRRHEEQPADETRVKLTDPDNGTVMSFVPPLPDEAIVQLASLKPRQISNKVIAWESSQAKWIITRKP